MEKTLIMENSKLRSGFTSIPNTVLMASGLSIGAKLVYGLLLMFAWQENECFPGHERLSRVAEISVRQVQRYLIELRDYGLITWRRRGQNQTNVYYIKDLKFVERLKIADTTNMSYKEYSVENVVVDVVEDDRQDKIPSTEETTDIEAISEPDNTIREIQELAQSNCNVDLPEKLITGLLKEFPSERIKEKIELVGTGTGQIRNMPGLLLSALRDNYVNIPGQKANKGAKKYGENETGRAGPPTHTGENCDHEGVNRRKELIKRLYLS